jgi:RimJ/RimL family protein N-acetyltransferase
VTPAVEIVLRSAVPEDGGLLWEWANDPVTRQSSFSTAPIALDEHLRWLALVLDDAGRSLFIAELDGHPVGQVRLDRIDDSAIISVSIAPEARGRGLAAEVIRSAIRSAEVPVVAHVRASNEPSRKAFRRAGFQLVDRVDDVERYEWGRPSTAAAPTGR